MYLKLNVVSLNGVTLGDFNFAAALGFGQHRALIFAILDFLEDVDHFYTKLAFAANNNNECTPHASGISAELVNLFH